MQRTWTPNYITAFQKKNLPKLCFVWLHHHLAFLLGPVCAYASSSCPNSCFLSFRLFSIPLFDTTCLLSRLHTADNCVYTSNARPVNRNVSLRAIEVCASFHQTLTCSRKNHLCFCLTCMVLNREPGSSVAGIQQCG